MRHRRRAHHSSRACRRAHTQRRLRPPVGGGRPRRAGARPALLRRTGRLEPAGALRMRHQPGARDDGRREPAGRQPVGPGPVPGRARGASSGRSDPDGCGRVVLRRDVLVVPGRARRPGGGRGGERLLLIGGGQPPDAMEHVRLAGPARHARTSRTCRPGCAGGPAPAARSSPASTIISSRWPWPAARSTSYAGCTASSACPTTRWSHDVFDAGHQWHATLALPFLARTLGLDARRSRQQ